MTRDGSSVSASSPRAGVVLLFCLFFPSPPPVAAQNAWFWEVGGDVVSRAVWRGFPQGAAVSLQPWIAGSWGGVYVETSGSYAADGGYTEQDLLLTWSREAGMGTLTLSLEDYFVSERGDRASYFDLDGVEDGEPGGGHTVELGVAVEGIGDLPLAFFLGWNVYNDPDHSAFAQLAVSRDAGPFGLCGRAGVVLNRSNWWYEVDGGEIAELSLGAELDLFHWGERTVYASGEAIRNPALGRSFFVMTVGI